MAAKVFDWIAHHAHTIPDKKALHDLHNDRAFTYAEMNERVGRFAGALAGRMNVARGNRVAVLASNTTDMIEVYFACARLGAVCVPLNWRLTVPELEFILSDCAPRVLIHEDIFANTAAALGDSCNIDTLIELSAEGDSAYETAIRNSDAVTSIADLTHDDLWSIMYTSGTTGRPKGAMITHGMIFWQLLNAAGPHKLSAEMVQLMPMPLFHAAALHFFTTSCLHLGGTSYIMHTPDPAECIRYVSDPGIGATHFGGVPTVLQGIAQHPDFENADFSRLKSVIVGGAAVPVEMLRLYQEKKGVILEQIYGMTETNLATALSGKAALERIGSAGTPVLHAELKLVDDKGNDIPEPDVVGEIFVRGPNVTPGYWNRDDANRESFTDGWIHTGDAATRDADGFYYIVDRWKDMYISGGENVYPAEIEDVLYQLEEIAEVAVIGVPDEKWGEVGCAVVALKSGRTLAEADILRHCDGKLARFKQPKSVRFIDELPHGATGKVLKRELREAIPA